MGKFRHSYGVVLACALVVAGAASACGSKHDGSGGGPDGGPGGTISSIAVSPAMATVALTGSGSAYTAAQAFTVTATYADGATADVTASATWDADDENAVMFAGTSTATVTIAGSYQVYANVGGVNAAATLTATLLDGSSFGSGFDPTQQAGLDGTPDGTHGTPTIAYPLAGSLFPVNIAPIEVHAQKSDPKQTIARISFAVDGVLTYSYYANCAASPNPGTFANACIVPVTGEFATQLAGASESADVQLTVRPAANDGSVLAESAATALAWSKTPLTGGLYYWTTAGAHESPTFATAIARYDFAGDTSKPVIDIKDTDIPKVPNNTQCLGCHAVSPDGSKLAFSTGGSTGGYFDQYDIATTTESAFSNTAKFDNMTTYSPDGTRMVGMAYGVFTLRDTTASLTTDTANLMSTAVPGEMLTHPNWSSSGKKFAFTSWIPNSYDVGQGSDTGDMAQGGEVWISDANSSTPTGTPTLLVPRAFTPPTNPTSPTTDVGTGVTNYYPNISDDDQFVVFNQSHCDGPSNLPSTTWGQGPCDGYNDISATLWVVPAAGGAPVRLDNANGPNFTGKTYPEVTNSWPRWSPDHGTFRGKTLYWVAFSSRRQYGLSLASGAGVDTTKPQLWFAAVAIDGTAAPTVDPSFAPVWLPGQDPDLTGPRGNHTPAWTAKAVQILQ